MSTIHLVYPHGDSISCPDAIGRKLGKYLHNQYRVIYYDLSAANEIKPEAGDVLLGHPHPAFWTIFRRSARLGGWKRAIALAPYNGDPWQVAFLDRILPHCDLFLAITGNYWYDSIRASDFSHWLPKMVHVDLAVDRGDFPVIKTRFNPPGQRRFLYIGHSQWMKNTGYLSRIARAMPEAEISWMGSARRAIPGVRRLGYQDFRRDSAKELVASHDFVLNVSRADANPATLLEAMAWGLIPVCTRQSGYAGYPSIPNLPLNDTGSAVAALRELQSASESKLLEIQYQNWILIASHFNWDRLFSQVASAIESSSSPRCRPAPLSRTLRLRWAELASPNAPYRSSMLKALVRSVLKRRRSVA